MMYHFFGISACACVLLTVFFRDDFVGLIAMLGFGIIFALLCIAAAVKGTIKSTTHG